MVQKILKNRKLRAALGRHARLNIAGSIFLRQIGDLLAARSSNHLRAQAQEPEDTGREPRGALVGWCRRPSATFYCRDSSFVMQSR
ncbi:hypothetical protein KC335_g39 [Hortaea werneckii]|nr:hypothetical protein KC335_g39 [Hortaea werneckii]